MKTDRLILRALRLCAALCMVVLVFTACPDGNSGGTKSVTFSTLSANGSPTATTTKLTLGFDKDISGLTAADITLANGSTGAYKGALTGIGAGIYELALHGILMEGTVTIGVSKSGYDITGSPKTATLYYCYTPSEMVWIPAGTFTMGSPADEPGRIASRETQHTVTLTKDFYIGRYQVTQEQWVAVMRAGEDRTIAECGKGDDYPIYNVYWYDALVFCNKLSLMEGLTPAYRISGSTDPAAWGTIPTSSDTTWNAVEIVAGSTGYRLPTEAQWEYACRAETTSVFNWNTNIISSTQANYNASSVDACNLVAGTFLGRTTEVGSYAPNAWGLYDMHGNVWEWCWDWYDANYGGEAGTAATDPTGAVAGARVARGGSWNSIGLSARSAYRGYYNPSHRNNNLGFRLVRP